MKKLFLYTTVGCHLCEQAAALVEGQQIPGLVLEEVEISDSEPLMERYAVRIPVLQFQGRDEELGWPFTENELQAFLTGELTE